MGDVWTDCDKLAAKYPCRIWVALGGVLFAAVVAGLTWFVIEYRNQQMGISEARSAIVSTKDALVVHTEQEAKSTAAIVVTLQEVQKSVQSLQTQVGIMDFRLNGAPLRMPVRESARPASQPSSYEQHTAETSQ
jgi:hypothetical protein